MNNQTGGGGGGGVKREIFEMKILFFN
jgi:hypothetical protein